MPHDIWLKHIPLGNPERRRKDRLRKSNLRAANTCIIRPLATYKNIAEAAYMEYKQGNYITKAYKLYAIANIYGLSRNTVRRWYNNGMLPPLDNFGFYTKEQIFVICKVLNNIFEQGCTQFRQSHYQHLVMMEEGFDIAQKRLIIKANRKARKPLPILPPPSEWPELRRARKRCMPMQLYRPTMEDYLLNK